METNNISAGELDFLGGIPCPIKNVFKDSLEEYFKDETLKYYPFGTSIDNYYENLSKVSNMDDFPSSISFGRLGEFFSAEFVNKFVEKRNFKAVSCGKVNKEFLEADLIDQNGSYTVYRACPTVIVVDKKELGDLPVPKSWEDLLNPIYKGKIVLSGPGEAGVVDETILLYYYKEFGEDGLRRLARNVKGTYHTSEIGQIIAHNSPKAAAIYLQWLFFAEAYPRREYLSIVWPSEGAMVTPLCALFKESEVDRLKVVRDFLFSKELGDKLSYLGFPMINSEIDNKLPASFLVEKSIIQNQLKRYY